MNPLKLIVSLLLLAAVGVIVYRFFPEIRGEVRDRVGWSEEARREDPLGYVDHALESLEEDEARFAAARENLVTAKREAESRRKEYSELHATAVELADQMKTAYEQAEAGGGYPIAFRVGTSEEEYTREEFLNQVTLTLAQRDTYEEAVADLTAAIEQIEESRARLASRMSAIDAHRTELRAQRSVIEVRQLTGGVEELMANVEELLAQNVDTLETLPEDDDPVRTLDQFIQALEAEAAAAEGDPDRTAALEFLEG